MADHKRYRVAGIGRDGSGVRIGGRCMKQLALLAALASLASTGASAQPSPVQTPATSDDEFCAALREIDARSEADFPQMVDSATRSEGIIVTCGLRTVSFPKTIFADVSALREGWQGRKQQQFNEAICGDALYRAAVRRGWRFVHALTFRDGTRIDMDARCD